jgi:hypothetical protein
VRCTTDVVARVRTYAFPPERLSDIGRDVRAAVHAEPRGYDERIAAAFLGVDRETGSSVAVTVAGAEDALRRSPAEPHEVEPAEAEDYTVTRAFVAAPDALDTSTAPRLYLSRAQTSKQGPSDLVYAAFTLERASSPEALAVVFAEWPEWGERAGVRSDVYDLEYFLVRHG